MAPLGPGEVIGVPDIDLLAGDAVLLHTGWGAHWNDAETYLSGEPGPGMELATLRFELTSFHAGPSADYA